MTKRKRIIQVPIEEELLEQIDATAGMVGESRASLIREACKQRLKSLETEELDRQYVEGYRKNPEELDWPQTPANLLSKRLPKEKWSVKRALIKQRLTAFSPQKLREIDEAIRFALNLR